MGVIVLMILGRGERGHGRVDRERRLPVRSAAEAPGRASTARVAPGGPTARRGAGRIGMRRIRPTSSLESLVERWIRESPPPRPPIARAPLRREDDSPSDGGWWGGDSDGGDSDD